MTKDRIKHFDDMVIRLRLQGIPIASAIFAAGLVSLSYTRGALVPFLNWPLGSLIILFGSLYLIPIFFLDLLHYKLLLIAVKHAMDIEKTERYRGRLQITTLLTSRWLTRIHTTCAIMIYVVMIVAGILMAVFIR